MEDKCIGCGNELQDSEVHHMECPIHGDEFPLCATCADKFSFEHEHCSEGD